MKVFDPMEVLAFIGAVLLISGCGHSSHEELEPVFSAIATASDEDAIEAFVFVAPSERQNVGRQFEALVLTGLSGGSLVHLIETDSHRVIASVSVPFGTPKTRVKNKLFQQQYAVISDYFETQPKPDCTEQLGLPAVSETVASLRRTNLKCRIILCGSPFYDDKTEPTFTMIDGLVPSDGLIGHALSPWTTATAFPANTTVSWLVSDGRWGKNAKHRKWVTRFNRIYLKELGGHVVRITPDPELAFSFAEPHLKNDVSKRSEVAAMLDPHVNTELEQAIERDAKIIPVKKPNVSLYKPGSFEYMIEMDGGDPAALAGEAIVLWLIYDGSGSMATNLANNNETILKIAESLPPLVKSLEVGISVHRDNSVDTFPIALIKDKKLDGGKSLRSLKTFLSGVRATSGDAEMEDMLNVGIEQLSATSEEKRQFMMLVADHVQIVETEATARVMKSNEILGRLQDWCNQSGTDRRAIAMYSGDEGMKLFFLKVGALNSKSFFSERPDDLIDALLSAAIPSPTPNGVSR